MELETLSENAQEGIWTENNIDPKQIGRGRIVKYNANLTRIQKAIYGKDPWIDMRTGHLISSKKLPAYIKRL